MTTLSPDNELIERYLLGKLNDAEIRDFKLRLEEDREFARKYRLIKTFPEMMSESGRKELERIQADTQAKASNNISILKKYKKEFAVILVIAAVVVIAIAIYSVLINRPLKKEEPVAESTPVAVQKAEAQPKKDTVKKASPQTVTPQPTSDAIQLLTPANGAAFSRSNQLMFTWKMKTDTFTRFYIISEDTRKIAFWRGIKPGIRQFSVPGNTLYPGKYTWYVGTKNPSRTITINE
ncbi:MAG: hypothetical protein Q8867_07545 [Bacteroidota bacterium]|nr:hypothetical protein [Bacteroidota bacterium]